jgi:hypothetical protein
VRHFGTLGQVVSPASEVGAAADFLVEPVWVADFLVEAVGDGRFADSSDIFIKVNEKMK